MSEQHIHSGDKLIIIGAMGMLGRELTKHFLSFGYALSLFDVRPGEVQGLEVKKIDITCEDETIKILTIESPKVIINCAAYTKVDDAEKEQELAFRINTIGPAILASCARRINSTLVHYSTDYVFGGGAQASDRNLRAETQETFPINIYGQSKRLGDEFVSRILSDNHLILRTSWLHGAFGPNFVDTMLKVGKANKEIKVVNDQIGSPTWTGWLVEVTRKLLEAGRFGLYNVTCRGNISWYDFAKEIFKQAKIEVNVLPQSTVEAGRLAVRPAYSTLCLDKLEKTLGVEAMTYQEGIKHHLAELNELHI